MTKRKKPNLEELTKTYEELLKARDSYPRGSESRFQITGYMWAIAKLVQDGYEVGGK